MANREITASGRDALVLVTDLLHRMRQVDPVAGLWEAADVQWWWRRPRRSDEIDQTFWIDDIGAVAAVWLTSWSGERWQCDPIRVPDDSAPAMSDVWERARHEIARYVRGSFDVPVRDDDHALRACVRDAGLRAGERSTAGWLNVDDRPEVVSPPAGFTLVDRTARGDAPHPMRIRNGNGVADRLAECSLYDPQLDLAVETADGGSAGYSLYWFDPVTRVGLVEPVRIEDEYQRLGLARAMLTEGLRRLTTRGATRIKIGWGTSTAGSLYESLGFRARSTDTWFRGVTGPGEPRDHAPPHPASSP